MPQIEAAACGIPIATVNYSAMIDVINKLDAYPIRVGSFFKELETKAIRVYPDNSDLITIIKKLIRLRPNQIKEKKKNVRTLSEMSYDWDKIAKVWENFFDSPWLFKAKKSWSDPPNYLIPDTTDFDKISIKDQFVTLYNICSNNLKSVDKMSTMFMLDMCKDASYGFSQNAMNIQGFSYKDAINNINVLINNHNQAEKVRSDNIQFPDDFIKYADLKVSS